MKALVKSKMSKTTMESSDSSTDSNSSPESSRKFWNKPSKSSLVTRVEYSDQEKDMEVDRLYALPKTSTKKHTTTTVTSNTDAASPSQRRQTKVLLVSLIESLCKTYGGTPETTRKMFFNICQTLRTLGFIDSEFHDDVASIRFTYHKAFEHIFYAAAQNVREDELRLGNQPKLLTSAEQEEFIKEHIESLSPEASSSFFASYSDNELLSPLKYSLNHIQNSRYQNDFIEVGMLGRGGFASAYKVRNKLDDVEYAIKKIRLGDDDDEDDDAGHAKILREIKNLARLEHHNVVRYYSSWLEYANELEHRTEDEEDEDEDEPSWLSSTSQDDRFSVFNGRDPTFDDSVSSHHNNHKHENNEEMSFISFGHSSSASCSSNDSESTTGNLYLQPSSSTSTVRKSTKMRKNDASGGFILYIQMQLCPSTLHEYLKYRNQNRDAYFDEQQNIELFVQILEGAAYIHQEGLIHRDLKPSNIFLSRPANNLLDYRSRHNRHHCECKNSNTCNNNLEAMVPKIGDFGLAASVLPHSQEEEDLYTEHLSSTFDSEHSSHSSVIELFTTAAASLSSSSSLANKSSLESDIQFLTTRRKSDQGKSRPGTRRNITSGVGTPTYAAPEQLAIPSLPYDEKADIYSLGIILFELYNPFSTAMERADTIANLKKGLFPPKFNDTYPTQANIIRSMMNPDPCLRPTALQLLDHELFQPYYTVQDANEPTTSKSLTHNQEMAEMRYQYDQIKHENEALQRRLEELQSKLDHCQMNDTEPKKRHHTIEEEEECSAQHEAKKKELDF